MIHPLVLLVLVSFFVGSQECPQCKNIKDGFPRERATSFKIKPIETSHIFIDIVKTSVETNKRGNYKIKLSQDKKLITVYNPKYGFINWESAGENKVEFVFPEISELFSEDAFKNLGYTATIVLY